MIDFSGGKVLPSSGCCLFLAGDFLALFFDPEHRWNQYVRPKRQTKFYRNNGVTIQMIILINFFILNISHHLFFVLLHSILFAYVIIISSITCFRFSSYSFLQISVGFHFVEFLSNVFFHISIALFHFIFTYAFFSTRTI